jgi:hypothetical protein
LKLKDSIQLARNALKGSRLRTNLTVAIIAIGITALIGIVTVIEVLKTTIQTSFSGMGSNTFNITSEDLFMSGSERRRRKKNTEENRISFSEALQFKERYSFPSTISINTMATGSAIVKRGKKRSNPNVSIFASDENYLNVADISLSAGRPFTQQDIQSLQNYCIIGDAIAKKYFKQADIAVNNTLSIGDAKYKVIGVMESKGSSFINRTDNMILIGLTNARQRCNLSNKSFVISIRVNDIKYIELAKDEAEGIMRQVKRLSPKDINNFSVTSNNELASSLIENISMVTLSAALIGLIPVGAAIG